MNPRHLLDIEDLSPQDIRSILKNSYEPAIGVLNHKGVALLFEKPSARTRHSMEMAVWRLGGHPINIDAKEVGIGQRESAADIARTLACYHSAIAARVFSHQTLIDMKEASPVAVINMLSDKAHPLQALADMRTIENNFGSLKGLKLAFIGDFNNVANSLAQAAQKMEMNFSAACPQSLETPHLSDQIVLTHDPKEAAEDADVIYTDVWTSMGQEDQAEDRKKAFRGFQVDAELMKLAKPSAIFMHCLPAHRGEEAAGEVIDGPQSRVWEQAENRMHTAIGLFCWLSDMKSLGSG